MLKKINFVGGKTAHTFVQYFFLLEGARGRVRQLKERLPSFLILAVREWFFGKDTLKMGVFFKVSSDAVISITIDSIRKS